MSYVTAIRNFSPGNVKIATDYSFSPQAGVISVSGLDFTQGQVLLIVNSTRGQVIQDVFNSNFSCKVIGRNIELDYDTTTMDRGDTLIIYLAINEQSNEMKAMQNELLILNKKMDNLINEIKLIRS